MARWITLAVALFAAYMILSALIFATYTSQRDAVPDFYIEWVGTRVALSGGNPYSQETTELIQVTQKGRLAGPGEDQLAFVYPFYRVFLTAPIAFLPYAWASAFWLAAMTFCLVGGVLLTLATLDWRPSPAEVGVILLASILTFPAFGALMLGQMAVGVFALLCLAGWAERTGRPALAGAALALATVKPQLAALVLPIVAMWWLVHRQWRGLAGLGLGLGALAAASSLVYRDWPLEFARALTLYPAYKDVRATPQYLFAGLGLTGDVAALIVWGLLATWLALAWRAAWSMRAGAFANAFVLTMAMSCLLLPQTSIVNALLCLPACILVLRESLGATSRPPLVWAGWAAAVIVVPWVAYAALYRDHYGLAMALTPSLAAGWLGLTLLRERPRIGAGLSDRPPA